MLLPEKGKYYIISLMFPFWVLLFWSEISAQCSNSNVVKVADMFQEVLSMNSTINSLISTIDSLIEVNRIQVM